MEKTKFYKAIAEIQRELKAPKGQRNSFGNYNYRSCEDIVEAAKPLLGEIVLTMSDDVVEIGGRVFVKATARLSDGENVIETTALAREAEQKKGMDAAQITGSSSSYARKYALNGLFAIDDTRDPDTRDNRESSTQAPKMKCRCGKVMVEKSYEKDGKKKLFAVCPDKQGKEDKAHDVAWL